MSDPEKKQPFDLNEDADKTGFRLPTSPADVAIVANDFETFVGTYTRLADSGTQVKSGFHQAINELVGDKFTLMNEEFAKALGVPPTSFAYSRINYMPDPNASGILPWPGIAPEALAKIARENVAPQLIIGMRCDDVLRYSNLSDQMWRPGWTIEPFKKSVEVSDSEAKDILDAQKFLSESNIQTNYTQARERDAARLTGFQNFLSAGTRDWLTFDQIAIWTDMDNQGKVKAYSLLPAGNIRLSTFKGYMNNPLNFAVGVDEGGKVIEVFTRDNLTFVCRNPRTNVETSGDLFAAGYGYPEIELAIRLIQGFQNAIDLNVDVFNRNGVPDGILTIIGATQRQLDFINRLWTNIKRGITKKWAMPVIGLPNKESELKLIDLSGIDQKEAYYQEWMNMLAGALCTLWRFPVRRLGYRIGGKGKDTEPMPDSSINMVDEDDPGLAPLLGHWETVINEYLIWSRWPHLRFKFTGANPKEDARSYEFKRNSMTYGEARQVSGLKPLSKVYDDKHKIVDELMERAPLDANLSGVFQTIASAYVSALLGDGESAKENGNSKTEKKDPAKSESHGHTSGVSRDSAAEA